MISNNIRMISEGSCDIEDWSNYAENSALPLKWIDYILKYINSDQINATLVRIIALEFFEKHKKIFWTAVY